MTISDDKKAGMFRMLSLKSMYETGVEFGLDKHYRSVSGVKSAVRKIYNEVRQDPQKYFLQQDTVDLVVAVVDTRKNLIPQNPTLKEQADAIDNVDIKTLIMEGRRKAFKLLSAKMDRLMRSKKSIDEANLASMGTVFGILFDKGQIIQGEATENVAIMGKIKTDMTPEEALDTVLKMRESNLADKDRKKK